MSLKRFLRRLFGESLRVDYDNGGPAESVSFNSTGLTEVQSTGKRPDSDSRLEFNKDLIMSELEVPPFGVKKDELSKKIKNLNKVISSLKKKKFEASAYSAALEQLKNRKRLTKKIEVHLGGYPITTLAKITKLARKYRLVFNPLGRVTRDIPLAAVRSIEKFCKPLEKGKMSFGKDDFFLVAPEDWWQKKRDPILLVKSPVGNYYHILYAWDEEVDIVAELFRK